MVEEYNGYDSVDRWIRSTFFTDWEYKGVMVEVGGGLPDWINNSYHWRVNGWRTLCIEPNPQFAQRHREIGSEVWEGACANWNGESEFVIVGNQLKGDGSQHSFSHLKALEWRMSSSMKDAYDGSQKEEIVVKVRKFDTIMEEVGIQSVDILSIDVEGGELSVLSGIDLSRWKPKVIQIENLIGEDYTPLMVGYRMSTKLGNDEIWIPN